MIKSENNLPPMLQSYLSYKERYPHCIILFQVGDFYESFFDDAVTLARTLNLTLTSRDKNSDSPIPMCGVPISVIDGYIGRAVNFGYSLAIISQEPVPVGFKGSVPRKLERIITPGVRILDSSDTGGGSILACITFLSENSGAISYTDIQSGKIFVREEIHVNDLNEEIARINPSECLLIKDLGAREISRRTTWVRGLEMTLGTNRPLIFRSSSDPQRQFSEIKGYSTLSEVAKQSVKQIINYIDEVTVSTAANISEISLSSSFGVLAIDSSTRTNLDLVESSRGGVIEGSLLWAIDRTVTIEGRKLLKGWILNPLTSKEHIEQRLDAVATFIEASNIKEKLVEALRLVMTMERVAIRIELQAVTPRELGGLRDSAEACLKLKDIITPLLQNKFIAELHNLLSLPQEMVDKLQQLLVDAPPISSSEGGIIKEGAEEQVDHLRSLAFGGKQWLLDLETRERSRTGITSLKIRYNKVFGYYIEITNAHVDKVPPDYVRKQTIVNGERFITEELKSREEEVLGAQASLVNKEKEIFEELKKYLIKFAPQIRAAGKAISTLDVLSSLANYAEHENCVRPKIMLEPVLSIQDGRHPVLSRILKTDLVPNTLELNHIKRAVILTGPNMGGKSTFLRQAALITILAQIGSYIPATSATIGIVDKVFARIGASDNLRDGESTFMVEMKEVANIIAGATENSLIVIDEVGRGTATADGVALAQAILEWIITTIKSRVLFATHFHELVKLDTLYSSIQNLSVTSVEEGKNVIFTHKIKNGPASKAYGIEVAKLAGIPKGIVRRADYLLDHFHSQKVETSVDRQLSIFESIVEEPPSTEKNREKILTRLGEKLEVIKPEEMTPLQALNALYELREEYLDPKLSD